MYAPDHSTMGDALIYTACAYYLIGLVMMVVAVSVWWTHPINRAFLFGPYLTEGGIRLLLHSWPFVFLFGAFIFSCAAEHHVHWLFAHDLAPAELVDLLGTIEAVISVFTALCVAWWAARAIWRRVWKRRG